MITKVIVYIFFVPLLTFAAPEKSKEVFEIQVPNEYGAVFIYTGFQIANGFKITRTNGKRLQQREIASLTGNIFATEARKLVWDLEKVKISKPCSNSVEIKSPQVGQGRICLDDSVNLPRVRNLVVRMDNLF